jgi:hypothetical protein
MASLSQVVLVYTKRTHAEKVDQVSATNMLHEPEPVMFVPPSDSKSGT